MWLCNRCFCVCVCNRNWMNSYKKLNWKFFSINLSFKFPFISIKRLIFFCWFDFDWSTIIINPMDITATVNDDIDWLNIEKNHHHPWWKSVKEVFVFFLRFEYPRYISYFFHFPSSSDLWLFFMLCILVWFDWKLRSTKKKTPTPAFYT